MRVFENEQGERWQAALLEASYGYILLIFSQLRGGDTPRQFLLGADYMAEASRQLAEMDEAQLRDSLAKSKPWTGMAVTSIQTSDC